MTEFRDIHRVTLEMMIHTLPDNQSDAVIAVLSELRRLYEVRDQLTAALRRFTDPPQPARVCFACGKGIFRRHKYVFEQSSIRHRDCANPEMYVKEKEKNNG